MSIFDESNISYIVQCLSHSNHGVQNMVEIIKRQPSTCQMFSMCSSSRSTFRFDNFKFNKFISLFILGHNRLLQGLTLPRQIITKTTPTYVVFFARISSPRLSWRQLTVWQLPTQLLSKPREKSKRYWSTITSANSEDTYSLHIYALVGEKTASLHQLI